MIVFALGCLAGLHGSFFLVSIVDGRRGFAATFAANAIVAAAAGISLAIWGTP